MLAQVVLAGIVPNWPADKVVKVYEICISDIIVKAAVVWRHFSPDDEKAKCHDKPNRWRREANKIARLFVLTARQ